MYYYYLANIISTRDILVLIFFVLVLLNRCIFVNFLNIHLF